MLSDLMSSASSACSTILWAESSSSLPRFSPSVTPIGPVATVRRQKPTTRSLRWSSPPRCEEEPRGEKNWTQACYVEEDRALCEEVADPGDLPSANAVFTEMPGYHSRCGACSEYPTISSGCASRTSNTTSDGSRRTSWVTSRSPGWTRD